MSNVVLVVLVNGDAVCAYPIEEGDIKKIAEIRQKVRERLLQEYHQHDPYNGKPKVQCQIVQVDMPACSPDGFIASLVNDIMDKVAS